MKQKVVALTLVVAVLIPSISLAQDRPHLDAAIRNAAKQAASQPAVKPASSGHHYLWPGIAMLGAGGTVAVLAATAWKQKTCAVLPVVSGAVGGGCVEEISQPLLWIGVGTAATGATLLAIGGSRHQVAVGATGVRYRVRF